MDYANRRRLKIWAQAVVLRAPPITRTSLQGWQELGIQFSLPFRHSFWKHDSEQGPLDVNFLEKGLPESTESLSRIDSPN